MDGNSPLDYAALIQEIDELDRILAPSGVRQVVDAHLDRVSAPTDDNNPLAYTAVMQDIDQLDEILPGVEYADHTDTHDNNIADSDVRHMGDVQLDRVSTTTDDNSPLDYAAMMQDIELDEILGGIEYANDTHTCDNVYAANCRVCSGNPYGSCTCTCRNCCLPLSGSIYNRCHSLPRCVVCHRHLPATCFPPNSPLCHACCNKQEKPHVRANERNFVTEVTIRTVIRFIP